jgi:hypothetical protein
VGPVFSLNEGYLVSPQSRIDVTFAACDLSSVSAFVRITLSPAGGSISEAVSTTARCELRGTPISRQQDIIVKLIDTPEKLLRFLQLILALGQKEALNLSDLIEGSSSHSTSWAISDRGLLESLVEALARDPEALARLSPVIERIIETGDKNKVLPERWNEVWSAISIAKKQLETA